MGNLFLSLSFEYILLSNLLFLLATSIRKMLKLLYILLYYILKECHGPFCKSLIHSYYYNSLFLFQGYNALSYSSKDTNFSSFYVICCLVILLPQVFIQQIFTKHTLGSGHFCSRQRLNSRCLSWYYLFPGLVILRVSSSLSRADWLWSSAFINQVYVISCAKCLKIGKDWHKSPDFQSIWTSETDTTGLSFAFFDDWIKQSRGCCLRQGMFFPIINI